jgi:very-short-patch-repair endonuclease
MTRIFNRTQVKARRRSLRNNLPTAEIILWSKLKSRQIMGCKFRRQYSVGSYVIDFYCPELKLAIEIDGDSHYRKKAIEYDMERQSFIESFGIRFLRFTNSDVYRNLSGVLTEIGKTIEESMDKQSPIVLSKGDRKSLAMYE